MIDFDLTEDQKDIQKMVRDLMDNEVAPRAQEIDEKQEYPRWVHDLFARYDLFAATIPEEHGGIDGKLVTQCVVIEQVARVCASSSMIIGSQSLGSTPITLYGNDEQKSRWLPRLAAGEIVAGFSLTEPNAGTDATAMTSRAVPVDGGWRLNGRKNFITHASEAAVLVTFAQMKIDGEDRITAFLVETDWDGFEVDKIEHKMGLRGSPTCSLVMEDLFVPEASLLGKPGQGLEILMATLNKGRISVGAQALGIAQGALEKAAAYTTEREQFGRPLSRLPQVAQIVGQSAIEVEAARCLVYAAASKYDAKSPDYNKFSSMAKTFASDTAMRVSTDAVQVMGGYGYMVEYGVERSMRDAKVFQIFEGANQLQQTLVARNVFASV